MTTSPVCVPLSSSRSTNSLLVSASGSSKVGCGTCESSEPTNSSLVPSRFRPVEPMRTMLSGLSWRTWLTVYSPYSESLRLIRTWCPHYRRELHGIGGAMLVMVNEILLRRDESFLDRCVVGSHQNPPSALITSFPLPICSF